MKASKRKKLYKDLAILEHLLERVKVKCEVIANDYGDAKPFSKALYQRLAAYVERDIKAAKKSQLEIPLDEG